MPVSSCWTRLAILLMMIGCDRAAQTPAGMYDECRVQRGHLRAAN